MSNRTPKDIFTAHVSALSSANIDDILALRTDDSVLITSERTYSGKAQIGAFFRKLLDELPNAQWGLTAEVYHADLLYIDWTCRSDRYNVIDGVDTFVFRDGSILAQTARCSLTLAKLGI